jgi:RNA recognition motif-containing protein
VAKVLFVGNLPFSLDSEGLRKAFESAGEVTSANVISDRETQRSKGYGFVEMATDEGGDAAVKQLDGTDLDGRRITVSFKREKAA